MAHEVVENVFGRNLDVDVVTGSEDVIGEGGLQYWAASANPLSITSDSANDAVAGTGARDVHIEGLNASYNRVQEEIALNGLTPVVTKHSYIRVNSAYVHFVGATGTNEGIITLHDGTGVQASIQATRGETNKATYTVPTEDHRTRVVFLVATLPEKQAHTAIATLKIRFAGGGWRDSFTGGFGTGSPLLIHANGRGVPLAPRMDLRLNVTDADADNLQVAAGFFITTD